jgi:hypothetical protein
MTLANTEYVIYLTTKHGRTWRHLKGDDGWTRTGPNGRVHRLSAEQLLSHLLPPLAGEQPGLSVSVERKENVPPPQGEPSLSGSRDFPRGQGRGGGASAKPTLAY